MQAVGIDYPCMDNLVRIDSMPPENSYAQMLEYSWQGGGKVATAFIALGRLGISCGIVGVVGDDAQGRFIRDDFIRHGVDTSHLMVHKSMPTHQSLVISDTASNGRRIIGHFDKALETLTPEDILLRKDYFLKARYLHIARMDEAAVAAARLMRENGKKVLIDADSYHREIEDNLPLTDVFIGSEDFYGGLFPSGGDLRKNMESVLSRGPDIAVFTFGAKGCAVCCGDGFQIVPTFTHMPAVDTVGAGDVFHGAYLAALLRGMDPFASAKFANAVSSIKITRIGGRAGIPTFEMAESFLAGKEVDFSELDERVRYYRTALFQDR